MKKWLMMTCNLALIAPVWSYAGEELRGIAFLDPAEQRSIQCRIGSTVTEDDDRVDSLNCWDIKNGKRGRLVYEFSAHRYAVSLYAITPSLLLSEWGGGTSSCYQVIDYSPKTPRVIVDLGQKDPACSKAKMEIAYGQKDEVALLLELFDGGTSSGKSKVFCWKGGMLTADIVPWKNRFKWAQEHCWKEEP